MTVRAAAFICTSLLVVGGLGDTASAVDEAAVAATAAVVDSDLSPGVESPSTNDEAFILEALEYVRAEDWANAVPRLRAAVDEAEGDWIPEVFAGLAYAALAADAPDSAWVQVETGRQRYLEWLTGFAPEPEDRPVISLDSLELLLSGAHATLLAYGDSRRLAPLCFVVHPAGTHVFAIESDAVRQAMAEAWTGAAGIDVDSRVLAHELLRTPWSRVPDSAERLFLQPPLALLGLPFEDSVIPDESGENEETLADRYGVSFLPWSTMLTWSAAPRTKSGDGLVILGTLEGDDASKILGGAPRNAPEPATRSNFEELAPKADVLHLWKMQSSGANEGLGATAAAREHRPWYGGIRLDDAELQLPELAGAELEIDAALVDPSRVLGDPDRMVIALLAAGARSAFVLGRELSEPTVQSAERELYLALRSGLPRDRAVQSVRRLIADGRDAGGRDAAGGDAAGGDAAGGDTADESDASENLASGSLASRAEGSMPSLRVWGPGHLPVYSLMPKRGLGGLLISWVLFLTTGFFVLRFFVRRYVRTDGRDPS